MRLVEEILRAVCGTDPTRISYTVESGGGYFYNVRRILEYTDSRLVLAGKRGGLTVEGRSLSLGTYFAGDLVVRGEIVCTRSE